MESWFGPATFLVILVAALAGFLASLIKTWHLHRRVYGLECAVADLEQKILVEVKRRAGQERHKNKELDEKILEAAKGEKPKYWWEQYTPKVSN